MLQGKFIILGIPFLPTVNHPVDIHPRIFGEADVVVSVCQELNHLLDRPMLNVLFVEPLRVFYNLLCAILQDIGVFYLVRFGQFLF